ncbi:MAG: amidase [Candidatus Fermentithermobacillus carboniphilus]|uniref:Amidase n=1 Tax=Candidatus Fermentithermobacillus carboniphilus TaxID=3085328 RepID=A0AAT9LE96_9FIRM|nr:MAG: amidase [Candidatus Fermentithermobacillus carboniphilus]
MNKVSEMARLCLSIMRANEMRGYTVKYLNPLAPRDAERAISDSERLVLFGIKDTSQISRQLVQNLRRAPGYVWLTVDTCSFKGRAIDPFRINPLTGRVMTGSSSGSAINVLYGINDLAVGADGGGSVLGPALSCNLFGIVASGIGLTGTRQRISTDELSFVPGIGVISKDIQVALDAVEHLTLKQISTDVINEESLDGVIVGVPARGCLELPTLGDMRENLMRVVGSLERFGVQVKELNLSGCDDRKTALHALSHAFSEVDIVISYEGPIDVWGLGDSVLGELGVTGRRVRQTSGKFLIRAANMSQATSIVLPGTDMACGVVLMAKPGFVTARKALKLAVEIDRGIVRPPLFYRYFRQDPVEADDLFFGGEWF